MASSWPTSWAQNKNKRKLDSKEEQNQNKSKKYEANRPDWTFQYVWKTERPWLTFEAPRAVLEYLNRQNRPYSAIDICNNLHKEFGKTAIVKTCESLAEEGKIKEKVYGKQKVYVADQSQFPEVDDAEIKAMDGTISTLSTEVQGKQDAVRRLEGELKTLNSCISTEDARNELQQLTEQFESCKKKLHLLKEGGKTVSPEEKDRIYNARSKYVKEWRKRKRISNDILGAILEGYPKTKKQLYEEVGIETDEEYKVSPPEL